MLTVLLPENDRSAALRQLLEPQLPPGSDIRGPDAGLVSYLPYGPPPPTDDDLLQLARALDDIERQATRS